MRTKRMLELPLMEPPMMESERASATRRRQTRYTPLPGIMENAVSVPGTASRTQMRYVATTKCCFAATAPTRLVDNLSKFEIALLRSTDKGRRLVRLPVRNIIIIVLDAFVEQALSIREPAESMSLFSWTKGDVDIRMNFSRHVVPSGGTAKFHEGIERTTKEMPASASYSMKVKVVAPPVGTSSWHQTLPLRGSVVPAKLSACGIHGICFLNTRP